MNDGELARIFNFAILNFLSATCDVKPIMVDDETEDEKSRNPSDLTSDVESIMQKYAKENGNKSLYNYKDENFYNENKADIYNYELGSTDIYDNKSIDNGNEGLVNYYIALSGASNFEKSAENGKINRNVYSGEYTNIFSLGGDFGSAYENNLEKNRNNGVNDSVYKKGYGNDSSIYKDGYYGKNYRLPNGCNEENYDISNGVYNSVYGSENSSNENVYGIGYGFNNSNHIFDKSEKCDIYGFEESEYHDSEALAKYGEYGNTRYISENTVVKENDKFIPFQNYGTENDFNIFGKYTDLSFAGENSESDYALNTTGDYLNKNDVFNINKGVSENDESYVDYDIDGSEKKSELFSKMQKLTNETNNYSNSGGSININMGGVTQNFASGEGADNIMDVFVESLKKGLNGCGSRYLEAN